MRRTETGELDRYDPWFRRTATARIGVWSATECGERLKADQRGAPEWRGEELRALAEARCAGGETSLDTTG